jgi:hypothetical protein
MDPNARYTPHPSPPFNSIVALDEEAKAWAGGEVSAGGWAYLTASVCYFPSLKNSAARAAAL